MAGGNTVVLKVQKQGDVEALEQLKKIKEVADYLNKTNINVKISSSEAKKATDAVKDMATEAKKLPTAFKETEGAIEVLKGDMTVVKTTMADLSTTAEGMVKEIANSFSGLDKVLTSIENRVGRTLLMKMRNATTDAIQQMKAVDDQLVVVRKVSGASAEEVAAMGERAYETASKYGVAAADYLSSVASFVRAGYREQAEGLAEISVKTQLVGDVTEDVADQFLLSTDKAYKFGGSVKELNRVLDSANELDNKYATSIQKLASGMGIVAPVASQMKVGVDELMASIGTITAVTQRTGTEAARALRAIFLNIVGDTKTEIDEGVTWTTGEIAGLRDILQKYAPEAVAAAEASGELINPMEAIGGLAKSMEEGLLTEQELMEMVSDIGGKLRSSQLLALIQNWDMYNSMLEDIADSAGSADKEVENALDSWTRKTEILRNTWTQFLTNFINSNTFKSIIDNLTNLVQWLDKNQWAVKALLDMFIAIEAVHLFKRGITGAIEFAGQIKKVITLVQSLKALIDTFGFESVLPKAAAVIEKIASFFAEGGALGAGSIAAILAEFGGIFAVLGAIFGITYKVDEWADKKRHKSANKAISSGSTIDATNAIGTQWSQGVAGISTTGRGIGVTTGIAATDASANYAAYSDELRQSVAGFQYRHSKSFDKDGINSWNELKQYYNSLIALREKFESEGVDDDMYQWILGDIKEYEPYINEYENYLARMKEEQGGLKDANKETGESFEELAEGTITSTQSIDALAESLAGAKARLEEYNNAVSKGEKGDTLSSMTDAYNSAMGRYEAGEYGSTQYQEAMMMVISREKMQEIGYDWRQAGEVASGEWFQALFQGAEDGGQAFFDKLYEESTVNAEGIRGIFDELGNTIVEFTENEDGSLGFNVEDLEGLVELTDISGDALTALLEKIDLVNDGLNLSNQDIVELAEKAGALNQSVGEFPTIDVEKFFTSIVQGGLEAGESTSEIEAKLYNMQDRLMELSDVNLSVPYEELDGIRQKAMESAEAAKDLDDANAEPEVSLDTTAFDSAYDRVETKINTLNGKTATVTINTKTGSTHGGGGGSFAEGTDNAPGGNALTGEEGPELVLEGSSARIVGLGGPEITTLEPGAKVYTAEETEDILNRQGSRRIPAFWSGGRFIPSAAAKTKANKNVSKKSGATSSSAKSSAGTKEQTDAQKEQLDIHKAKVSLLESELDLLEAQNKPVKDQVAKIYEIQNALIDQINYMKSIGAEQEDINKLYTEWYKWQDQIAKLQKQIYDDLDDAIDNELEEIKAMYDEQTKAIDDQIDALKEARDVQADELELEEKRLAVEEARAKLESAQAERTVRMYNASTGQWEWVANAKNVQSAQEALNSAEEALAEYLEDMEYQAQVDALEAQKKHIEDEYDEIEAQWKEILDALEEPAKELGEVLADIAKNATADQREEIELLNGMLAKFGYAVPGYGRKYDNGGLLYGLGGIKATSAAEGVLSPELTAAMLSPQSNKVFSQRMAELGYLYGANKGIPSTMLAGGGRIGSQSIQNGNIYQYGNITLSEAQAKTTTVYELAQLSRNLSAYNRVN